MMNIFIKNGELIVGGIGKLATLEDLNEFVCMGNEPITGLIQIDSGVVSWYDSNELEAKEDNEMLGEVMEYVEHKEIKTLYMELVEDLSDGLEEITNICSDTNDICLRVVTRSTMNNTVYIYNYNRLENGDIDKKQTITHMDMLRNLFVA